MDNLSTISSPNVIVRRGDFSYGPNPSYGLQISGFPRCSPPELLSLLQTSISFSNNAHSRHSYSSTPYTSPTPSPRSSMPSIPINKFGSITRDFWAAQCVFYGLPIFYGTEDQLIKKLWRVVEDHEGCEGFKYSEQLKLLEEDLAREWRRKVETGSM